MTIPYEVARFIIGASLLVSGGFFIHGTRTLIDSIKYFFSGTPDYGFGALATALFEYAGSVLFAGIIVWMTL